MEYLNREKWILDKKSDIMVAVDLSTDTAFSDETQGELMDLEDNSWWFTYRAEIIIGLMDRYFSKNKRTLDIGGGNGYTSSVAKIRGYRIGLIEPAHEACLNAKKRGIDEVNCGAVTEDNILDDSIEQAMLLDVLEHIEDDKSFITLLNRKLVRGGYLLITVPAFMCLWSSEDDAAGHFRRYQLASICKLLEDSRFSICYRCYFMGFLFLPILFIRVFLEKICVLKPQQERSEEERKKIATSQFKQRGGMVKAVLSFFERMEMKLMREDNRVPFGSSIIIIARKQ